MDHRPRPRLHLPSLRRLLEGGLASVVSVGLVVAPLPALANPEGGKVVDGSATITKTSARKTDIHQHTDRAAIEWQSFDIGADEHTEFHQPSASSVALNRVVGRDPSEIMGRLTANGHVILVNPDGIHFGKSARVDVGALVATTHDIRTEDFMAGRMDFSQPGSPDASVVNEGSISVADQGLAAFVAPGVRNSGIVVARLGKVQLASATGFTLDLYGDGQLMFRADDKVLEHAVDKDGKPLNALVENDGTISADGGYVLLRADAVRDLVDSVINTSGIVEAKSVENIDGKIVLSGGETGVVAVEGRLDTSGATAGQMGGTIEITGEQVGVFAGADLDASGDAGGGAVRMGGNYKGQGPLPNAQALYIDPKASVSADALANGNGGRIVAWSDVATRSYGKLSARGGADNGDGGFIETSSAGYLDVRGAPDAGAANGHAGTWLLDPANLTIKDAATSNALSGDCVSNNTFCGVSGLDEASDRPDHHLTIDHDFFGSDEPNSVINTTDIEAALNAGTSVEVTTDNLKGTGSYGDDTGQAGTLTVADALDKTAGGDATLSLAARSDLTINAPITSTAGKLHLSLYSQDGGITSNQVLTTNGGNISLDAPGNIEFNNSGAARDGDLTVTAYGGSASANINVRWGADRIQYTHDGSRVNVPSNGISLTESGVTTNSEFYDLEGVFRNNAVTFGGLGSKYYYFDFNGGLYGAGQAVDGVAEFVNYEIVSMTTVDADAVPSGITPTVEVERSDNSIDRFTTINVASASTATVDNDQQSGADRFEQTTESRDEEEAGRATGTSVLGPADVPIAPAAQNLEETKEALAPLSYSTAEELAAAIYEFGDSGRNLNNDPRWNAYPLEMRQRAYQLAQHTDYGSSEDIAAVPAIGPRDEPGQTVSAQEEPASYGADLGVVDVRQIDCSAPCLPFVITLEGGEEQRFATLSAAQDYVDLLRQQQENLPLIKSLFSQSYDRPFQMAEQMARLGLTEQDVNDFSQWNSYHPVFREAVNRQRQFLIDLTLAIGEPSKGLISDTSLLFDGTRRVSEGINGLDTAETSADSARATGNIVGGILEILLGAAHEGYEEGGKLASEIADIAVPDHVSAQIRAMAANATEEIRLEEAAKALEWVRQRRDELAPLGTERRRVLDQSLDLALLGAGTAIGAKLARVHASVTKSGGTSANEIKWYPNDGNYRTADGRFASRRGLPSPGTRTAEQYTQFLEDNGFDVVGEEVLVRGVVGNRRYDAIIRADNGELWGIEYKSGGARKTRQQDFNDMYITRFGSYGLGRFSGQKVVGNITIFLP